MTQPHSPDRRRALGDLGEAFASAHLTRRGYRIIDRNFRTRWGELDIIAGTERTLIFCEVKTRRAGPGWRDPLESVHPRKQIQLRRMAGHWLAAHPGDRRLPECRFDAIGVTVDAEGHLLRLDHLEAAF